MIIETKTIVEPKLGIRVGEKDTKIFIGQYQNIVILHKEDAQKLIDVIKELIQ